MWGFFWYNIIDYFYDCRLCLNCYFWGMFSWSLPSVLGQFFLSLLASECIIFLTLSSSTDIISLVWSNLLVMLFTVYHIWFSKSFPVFLSGMIVRTLSLFCCFPFHIIKFLIHVIDFLQVDSELFYSIHWSNFFTPLKQRELLESALKSLIIF